MIFSELYSVYYNAVARIIARALEPGVTENDLLECVREEAFSESAATILPALKSGTWPLLHKDLTPTLYHKPTMPLTILQKRWLKAISADPRVKLFGVMFPALEDVDPLFTEADYKVYDRYADGDPYEDENYIRNFRTTLEAIKSCHRLYITKGTGSGKCVRFIISPRGLEYSVKDDKFRILSEDRRHGALNLRNVVDCTVHAETAPPLSVFPTNAECELVLKIRDERRALERALLHFSHFERQAKRLDQNNYLLRLRYDENDETELVIRVLSFGPFVEVVEPEPFRNLIKQRLMLQKNCGLK